ncbi:MAG: VOC family protein, partial [Butyricicoccus sp.]|nr:VOC family protein [Butyricicoccus sp.]
FEEDDFDAFAARLKQRDISYVHGVKEHTWGQRVVRIYDPDGHILEIGENMKRVCKRFLDSGMTEEEAAQRMDVPLRFIKSCTQTRNKER